MEIETAEIEECLYWEIIRGGLTLRFRVYQHAMFSSAQTSSSLFLVCLLWRQLTRPLTLWTLLDGLKTFFFFWKSCKFPPFFHKKVKTLVKTQYIPICGKLVGMSGYFKFYEISNQWASVKNETNQLLNNSNNLRILLTVLGNLWVNYMFYQNSFLKPFE